MKEKIIFLLIGQRGCGKSTYGKKLIEEQPELKAISRDEILIRLFGTVHTDPYTGGAWFAQEVMWKILRRNLVHSSSIKILLDCWTGNNQERSHMIHKLKQLGATKVVALCFTTPLEFVERWFWEKDGIAKMSEMKDKQGKDFVFYSESAPKRDYEMFHKLAATIDQDGFDEVIRINPQELSFTFS